MASDRVGGGLIEEASDKETLRKKVTLEEDGNRAADDNLLFYEKMDPQ